MFTEFKMLNGMAWYKNNILYVLLSTIDDP